MEITNEQLLEAYDRVPRPIRAFIANSELPPIVSELGSKHGLHVDTVGTLADLITKTLLGFVRPEVLPSMLAMQLHISEPVSASLLTDINERVFVPLQKRVRDAAEEAKQEAELEEELRASAPAGPAEGPVVPAKPAPLPPPALDYAPAAAPQTLPGSSVEVPMPVETAPHAATPQPTVPVPYVSHAPDAHPQGWHPAAAVHIFVPTHGSTSPATQHVPAIPANTPRAVEAPAPVVQAKPVRPSSPEPVQQPAAPAVTPRPISQDPYREPI